MDEQSGTSDALPKPKRVYEKFQCEACGGRFTIANKGKHSKTKKHRVAIGTYETDETTEEISDQE